MTYRRRRRHLYTLAPVLPSELLAIATPLHQALHELNKTLPVRALAFEELSSEQCAWVLGRVTEIALDQDGNQLAYRTAGAQ